MGIEFVFAQIIKEGEENRLPAQVTIDKLKEFLDSIGGQVRKSNTGDGYLRCFYDIPGKPNKDSKWIIPKHPGIPQDAWGKEALSKTICWYERKEDQFLYKVITGENIDGR